MNDLHFLILLSILYIFKFQKYFHHSTNFKANYKELLNVKGEVMVKYCNNFIQKILFNDFIHI